MKEIGALAHLDPDALISDAAALLQIPSPTGDERAALAVLAELATSLGLAADLHFVARISHFDVALELMELAGDPPTAFERLVVGDLPALALQQQLIVSPCVARARWELRGLAWSGRLGRCCFWVSSRRRVSAPATDADQEPPSCSLEHAQ